MAVAGEPLGYRHAVVLYSAQTTYGTPVTPATAVGICSVSDNARSSNQSYWGPGHANRRTVKGGETYTEVSVRIPAVQTGQKTLITKAVRASSVVPMVTLGIGYSDDGTPTRSAAQIQDVKCQRLRLGLDASGGHGPLTADMDFVGGLRTTLTTLAPATLTTTPWYTYEAVLTRGGADYKCRSWELTVEQTLSRDHIVPGATPSGFQRGHTYLTEHSERITGRFTRYAVSGVTVQANTVSTAAMQVVLTNLVDAVVLTVALTNVDFGEETLDVDENGIFWSCPFEAETVAIS